MLTKLKIHKAQGNNESIRDYIYKKIRYPVFPRYIEANMKIQINFFLVLVAHLDCLIIGD